jgi:hypothetical protein
MLTIHTHAIVVAKISELVCLDFVFLDFGKIHRALYCT